MEERFTKEDTLAAKGVAIVLMLCHHLFYATEQYVNYLMYYTVMDEFNITVRIAIYAKMCVPMFIVLSAYGLTLSYENWIAKKRSKESFALDRYVSLLSGFWVIFALGLVAGLLLERDLPSIYGQGAGAWLFGLLDGLGLANLLGTPTANVTWWYMSFAAMQIVALPLIYRLVKGMGGLSPLLIFVLISMGVLGYMPGLMSFSVLGVYLATANGFARVKAIRLVKPPFWNKCLKFLLYILAFAVIVTAGESLPETMEVEGIRRATNFRYLACGFFGVTLILFLYEFVFPLRPMRWTLAFLGKHSANIFMMHTFFYFYFFPDFYYEWEEPEFILALLLVTTLAASVVIELLKRLCGYDKAVGKLRGWVTERMNKVAA